MAFHPFTGGKQTAEPEHGSSRGFVLCRDNEILHRARSRVTGGSASVDHPQLLLFKEGVAANQAAETQVVANGNHASSKGKKGVDTR